MKTSELLLTFLLNAIWQIPLIASAAAVGAWLLNQSSAKYRHWVWVAALLLSLLVPSFATSRLGLNNEPASFARENIPVGQWTAVELSQVPFTAARTTVAPSSGAFRLNTVVAKAIIAVYVAFLVFGLFRLIRAWGGTRRITRSARQAEASEVLDAVLVKCQHLIGGKNVQILCSDSLPVPVTLGIRKQLIILPAKLVREGNVELLTSAIAHEFVHVCRRDYVLNLFYELVFALLSFHPVAALLRRRIKQTRELLCDELVADRVLEPEVYARSLVTLASAAPPRLSVNATVGIADADILEVRVMSLMNKSKLYPRSRKLLLIGVVLLLAVPSVTAMALAMRFNVDPFGAAVSQEQEQKEKAKEREKERVMERRSAEYNDGLRAGQKEAQRRKEPFTSEDEAKLKLMEELKAKGEALTFEDKAKLARLMQELEGRTYAFAWIDEDNLARQREEMKARDTRNAALVRLARIPMDQAIQIAISQQPGKVLESSLQGEHWEEPGILAKDGFVFYHISILSGDENSPTINHVWVNAVDGTIMRNEKELPRKMREPFREP
jgi:beta-lactamase regulating signal transducer with metallopeptidase domain/uncharacterized membrane protein YkoI